MANPSSSRHRIRPVVPKLFGLIEHTVHGDIRERAALSAALIAEALFTDLGLIEKDGAV